MGAKIVRRNAFSALDPKRSEEKRLIDAMLSAAVRSSRTELGRASQ